jgi:quercetin 2,3-dioxygenase
MANLNTETRLIKAVEVTEGAGVTVHRSIGVPALRNYDPFMLLDHFCSDQPDEYMAGFPSHPHRGFCTFTYMLDGHMEHRDSMDNTGNLGPGSAQLMKAASGIIHSEMPQQENGLMRGFQLWINLPARHKMDAPEYQEYAADAFPWVKTDHYQVRLLMGSLEGMIAPIIDDITQTSYFDVSLKAGKTFSYQVPVAQNGGLFVFEGEGCLNSQPVAPKTFVALGTTDHQFDFMAGKQGARFILLSALPINEPIVQYGPFVMNDRAEIEQAMQDYQSNNFIRHKAQRRHYSDVKTKG